MEQYFSIKWIISEACYSFGQFAYTSWGPRTGVWIACCDLRWVIMPLHLSVSTPSLASHELSHKVLGTLSTHPNFFLPHHSIPHSINQNQDSHALPPPKKTLQKTMPDGWRVYFSISETPLHPLESVADPETHGSITLLCFYKLNSEMASYMAISVTGTREWLLTSVPGESTSAEGASAGPAQATHWFLVNYKQRWLLPGTSQTLILATVLLINTL